MLYTHSGGLYSPTQLKCTVTIELGCFSLAYLSRVEKGGYGMCHIGLGGSVNLYWLGFSGVGFVVTPAANNAKRVLLACILL